MAEMNETLPQEDYDDDFLKNMTNEEYIDFVAQFLKPTPIEFAFVGVYACLVSIQDIQYL